MAISFRPVGLGIWMRVTFVLLAVYGVGALLYQMSIGVRHRRVALQLQSMGALVESSHYRYVEAPSQPAAARGIVMVPQSTLGYFDFPPLSYAARRIQRINVRPSKIHDFDAFARLLQELSSVNQISIYEPGLTAEQLEQIASKLKIQSLFVEGVKLPRSSLPFLKNQQLQFLYLGRSQFSNPAIVDLPLTLEHFDAIRTRISDEGLPQFVRLKNLKVLILSRIPCTAEGIENLREQMPWCRIAWEPLKTP